MDPFGSLKDEPKQASLLTDTWTPLLPNVLSDPMTKFGASLQSYRFGEVSEDQYTPTRLPSGDDLTADKENVVHNHALSSNLVMKEWPVEYDKVDKNLKNLHRNDSSSSSSFRGNDVQRDVEAFARTLSWESPSRSSFCSSSTSQATRSGRTGSLASSMRYPLLGKGDRRSSTSTTSRYSTREPDMFMLRPLPLSPTTFHHRTPYSSSTNNKPSHNVFKSQNPFVSLRRRFIPQSQGRGSRVETQLLGELLLALEDYVAAYGRRVKVSGPAVTMRSSSPFLSGPTSTHTSTPTGTSATSNTPSPLLTLLPHSPAVQLNLPVEVCRDVSDLAEEVDQTAKEVVEVCPAFGTALTLGLYGPLAVRTSSIDMVSVSERYAKWAPKQSHQQQQQQQCLADAFQNQTQFMKVRVDSEEACQGEEEDEDEDEKGVEERWWAERLLRDLIEGLVGDGSCWPPNPSVGSGIGVGIGVGVGMGMGVAGAGVGASGTGLGLSVRAEGEVALTGALAVLTEEAPLPSSSFIPHHPHHHSHSITTPQTKHDQQQLVTSTAFTNTDTDTTTTNTTTTTHESRQQQCAASRREQELMERGRRRWLAFQASHRGEGDGDGV